MLVKKNIVPMSRINDAVRRIVMMGLFENPLADYSFVNQLGSQVRRYLPCTPEHLPFKLSKYNLLINVIYICFGKQEHRELTREVVRKSLVLLKNGKDIKDPLLPLPKKAEKILVAGSHAHSIGDQCGGWTIEWLGGSSNITRGIFP